VFALVVHTYTHTLQATQAQASCTEPRCLSLHKLQCSLTVWCIGVEPDARGLRWPWLG
jgi:hypothetical protein